MRGLKNNVVRLYSLLAGALTLFFYASCGIDTIAYLTEKPTVQSSDESALVFKGPAIEDDNYYGVFLFYKIYAVASDAASDLNSLDTRQNAENAVPGSNVESFLVSPGGLDYKQLVLDKALSIPTLDKEVLSLNNFANLTFAAASNVEPTLVIKDASINSVLREFEARRNAIGSTGTYLSFLDEPQKGNQDYKSSTSDEEVREYYIQFFAAAYGLDFSDLSELYGNAVYLGRIVTRF